MIKLLLILSFFYYPLSKAAIVDQVRIIGVVQSFNKDFVKVRLEDDQLIHIPKANVAKKYKKIKEQMITNLVISRELYKKLEITRR